MAVFTPINHVDEDLFFVKPESLDSLMMTASSLDDTMDEIREKDQEVRHVQ